MNPTAGDAAGDGLVIGGGVHDELPPIDGLADRWGKSVFNCPFCDGWEHRDQPVVVIDAGPALVGDGTTLSHATLRYGRLIARSPGS